MKDAFEIATELLERTGAALKTGDFEDFQACFALPLKLSTNMGSQTITTSEGMHEVFERVRWHYRAQGGTVLLRECLAAMYLNDKTLVSVHASRLLANGQDVQRPFKAISTLGFVDDTWKILDSSYAIHDSLRHNRALSGRDEADKAQP